MSRRLSTRTRWVLGIGAAGLVVFGPGLYDLVRLSLREWQLNRRLAALEAQREELLREQERLESDPTYVEGLIRSTFKVSQPGEYVIPLPSESHGD